MLSRPYFSRSCQDTSSDFCESSPNAVFYKVMVFLSFWYRYENEETASYTVRHIYRCLVQWMPVSFRTTDNHKFEKRFVCDSDLTSSCTEYCWSHRTECIEICSADSLCIFQCELEFGDCFDYCPCQSGCPQGCQNCNSPFCKCLDPENSDEYIECEERVTESFDKII